MSASVVEAEALRADAVSFSYDRNDRSKPAGTKPVLEGLSAVIREGEVVGVLGPNGSGKTTFLRAALRFLRLESGTVSYFGRPDSEIGAKELSKILGLVPQRSDGGNSLTVREMVTLGRIPHLADRWSGFSTEDRRIVDHVMEGLDIYRLVDRICGSLSGGEFQKVLLARALVQESRILLLDEATSNLDLHHAIEIMDLVRDKARGGTAVVAVMHDLNLAAGYCDRVLLLKNGRVRYDGTPSEVYRPEVLREIFGVDVYLGSDTRGLPFVLPRRPKVEEAI
jgi:iron complex transport system ATP-binding protein